MGLAEACLRAVPALEVRHQGLLASLRTLRPEPSTDANDASSVMKTPPIKVNESEDALAQEQTKARRIGNAVLLTLTVQKHPDEFVFRWNGTTTTGSPSTAFPALA